MITSSVWLCWNASERNSAPRMGISPSPAIALLVWLVWSDSSPAMAKLWPLPSSTVVSALRTVSEGMVVPFQRDRAEGRELADLGANMQADAVLAEHGGHEGQADAVLLVLDADRIGAAALGDGDRELAADQEACGLAADRGQVRFGQDVDQIVLRQRVEHGAQPEHLCSCGLPDEQAAVPTQLECGDGSGVQAGRAG